MLLSIRELSKILGVSSDTIRRWEKEKRIPAPKRDMKLWRVYDDADIEKIKNILQSIHKDKEVSK